MSKGMTEEEYKQCLIQLDLLGVPKSSASIPQKYVLKSVFLYDYFLIHQLRKYVSSTVVRNITKAEFDDLLRKHIELSNDS